MKPAALTALVKTHARDVKRYLNRYGVAPSTIDDVAQDLWLNLLRLVDEDYIEQPRRYLFTTARNILFSQKSHSREKNEHCCLDDFEEELLSDVAAEDAVLSAQMRLAVRCAIGQLPPRQREYLLMHMEGLTYQKIAAKRGVTYNHVLKHLVRAYATLRSDPTLAELIS